MSIYARGGTAFRIIHQSTAPSFMMGATDVFASTAASFESTGIREWQGASSRTFRVSESAGGDYYMNFGTSDVVAASSDSILMLGGTVEIFYVEPSRTHVAIKSASTSTGVQVNITLGYGG